MRTVFGRALCGFSSGRGIPARAGPEVTGAVLLFALLVILTALTFSPAQAAHPRPASARQGMVVSSHPLASEIGVSMMKRGGNAVDAAVAGAFVLGVVEQYSSGLGGGNFMLIWLSEEEKAIALDGRETAPAAATEDMFLVPGDTTVVPGLSTQSLPAVGVPGALASLASAAERYGTLPLEELMAPAIALADTGFIIDELYAEYLEYHRERLLKDRASRAIYLDREGNPWSPGTRLRQPDLARTLRLIARRGPEVLYGGELGEKLARFMKNRGGLITLEDLRAYEVRWREPVCGTYRDYLVCSMPPPSSGGVHLIQMLNLLEPMGTGYLGPGSSESFHLLAEVMKLAFADRAFYLGDPDFREVPIEGLISKEYARELSGDLLRAAARRVPGPGLPPGTEAPADSSLPLDPLSGGHTTHLSVIDPQGNAVALTATINTSFGSGITLPGTGILLNNEMDDFSLRPGVPNYYGLVGAQANAIRPGKRPLSSMTPTVVLHRGRPALVLGSPGGPRIITSVLQTIVNVLDHGMDIQAAVDAPRVHHQWRPDRLFVEDGVPLDVVANLISRGHPVECGGTWSAVEAIRVDPETGLLKGGSDSRARPGARGF